MAFTRHGHPVYGPPADRPPRIVVRCGGPRICSDCATDVARFSFSNKKDTKMHTLNFKRRRFEVQAVQVTPENMEEVATWCEGTVKKTNAGDSYVKVQVHRPLNEKHTRAFPGDWVSLSVTGYKVYSDRAFKNSFVEEDSPTHRNVFEDAVELRVADNEEKDEETDAEKDEEKSPNVGANTPKNLFG